MNGKPELEAMCIHVSRHRIDLRMRAHHESGRKLELIQSDDIAIVGNFENVGHILFREGQDMAIEEGYIGVG